MLRPDFRRSSWSAVGYPGCAAAFSCFWPVACVVYLMGKLRSIFRPFLWVASSTAAQLLLRGGLVPGHGALTSRVRLPALLLRLCRGPRWKAHCRAAARRCWEPRTARESGHNVSTVSCSLDEVKKLPAMRCQLIGRQQPMGAPVGFECAALSASFASDGHEAQVPKQPHVDGLVHKDWPCVCELETIR